MTTVPHEPESNDASIEELLRAVGARNEPSSDAAREVMSAVHAEWLTIVQQRRRQQRVVAWRIAAGLALAVLVSTFTYRYLQPEPTPVASIAYVDGRLLASSDADTLEVRAAGESILVGDTVETDAHSRAAFAFADGLSLRLDHNTRVTVDTKNHITLANGAVYIDAPVSTDHSDALANTPPANALVVATSAGSVRHVGTQYEVRTLVDNGADVGARAMLVSVREGRVLVTGPSSSNTGEAGQVLRLSAQGELTRSELSVTDPRWQWALQAVPMFDIDDQSLATFLQWIARETGRHVVYSTPQAEAAASTVRLRGSIAGLDADSALAAVLSTTQLRLYQAGATEIGIELAPIDSTAPARQTH